VLVTFFVDASPSASWMYLEFGSVLSRLPIDPAMNRSVDSWAS
jgi:hypothetical protein